MGKENIEEKLREISEEQQRDIVLGIAPNNPNSPQLNSGMTNSNTPIEEVRKELTGQNGGGEI